MSPGSILASLDAGYPCRHECARDGAIISTVKVRVGVCHSSVAEGNCVGLKQRGEQPEANCRSVGERTRFGGGAATSLLM
jgi:hypothetical protein